MRAWALALIAGGCGFSGSGSAASGDGNNPPIDAPGDTDPGTQPIHVCLGTVVNACVDAQPVALSLMTGLIDTSDRSMSSKCLPATAYMTTPMIDACVIAGQSITIPTGNTVSVTGTRPLILLANASLTISGTLDAASHRGGRTGPAANTGPCPTNFTDPTTVVQGGGGWGGTFGGPGNNGGSTPGTGVGGIAGSALTIMALGGGCPGGKGADNASGDGGGNGGNGGGAVVLLGGQSIAIGGTVSASGGGGSGGRQKGGGGGGGSGGMIVVESPSVSVSGRCFANGGGGGEGGSGLLNGAGGGESPAPDMTGDGGASVCVGGSGGDGGIGGKTSMPGSSGGSITNPVDTGGGGGGGGGVGIIKIISPDQQHTADPKRVSPPMT